MLTILFWGGATFILYTYVGYPLALWIWRRVARPRPPRQAAAEPFVSIIVTVRNEEANIGRKLADLLAAFGVIAFFVVVVTIPADLNADFIGRNFNEFAHGMLYPGGDDEVLRAYHAGLVAPFCLSAARQFFDGF